jgi:DNA (cytosine-5)-methyltransferase 1
LDVTAQLAGWQTPTTSNDRKPNQQNALTVIGRTEQNSETIAGFGSNSGANAVNGFWGSADWLFCHDGKWRPVKPGLKPLVNGVAGRVGQLRAYGNAIVAPVAEAFISAYLESAQ